MVEHDWHLPIPLSKLWYAPGTSGFVLDVQTSNQTTRGQQMARGGRQRESKGTFFWTHTFTWVILGLYSLYHIINIGIAHPIPDLGQTPTSLKGKLYYLVVIIWRILSDTPIHNVTISPRSRHGNGRKFVMSINTGTNLVPSLGYKPSLKATFLDSSETRQKAWCLPILLVSFAHECVVGLSNIDSSGRNCGCTQCHGQPGPVKIWYSKIL
jgi:hypothetical protein